MELLKCHKVCELRGDKLHRPPVVALKASFLGVQMLGVGINLQE